MAWSLKFDGSEALADLVPVTGTMIGFPPDAQSRLGTYPNDAEYQYTRCNSWVSLAIISKYYVRKGKKGRFGLRSTKLVTNKTILK